MAVSSKVLCFSFILFACCHVYKCVPGLLAQESLRLFVAELEALHAASNNKLETLKLKRFNAARR